MKNIFSVNIEETSSGVKFILDKYRYLYLSTIICMTSDEEKKLPFTELLINGNEKLTFNGTIINQGIRGSCSLNKIQLKKKVLNAFGNEEFKIIIETLKPFINNGKIERDEIKKIKEIFSEPLEISFLKKEKKVREMKIKKKTK